MDSNERSIETMPQGAPSRNSNNRGATAKPRPRLPSPESNGNGAGRASGHYDRKLETLLRQAAAVFCARGYHQASMRDIARATGVSLAGLYYYFSGKEELLYLIQSHAFETLLRTARAALEPLPDPEGRLRAFLRLHLQFFLEHPNEMKVLTHEEEWLGDERRRDVRAIKKAYYRLCLDQVEALKRDRGLAGLNTRLAVLSLFGMVNWIYTWYNPKVDPGAVACAELMHGIFLKGILGQPSASAERAKARMASQAPGAGGNGVHVNGRGPSGGQTQLAGHLADAGRGTSRNPRSQRPSH